MTTYTLSKTSPINTVLADSEGTPVYEVKTPFRFRNRESTVTRGDQTIATVQWKVFGKSTLTMNGNISTIKEILPRSKRFSTSRVYTSADGQKFKWKDSRKLYCVSIDTGLHLATYYRNPFYLVN
ncbi:hypothetical protein FRC08_014586, partial [Ceratobasidium sp. 394]